MAECSLAKFWHVADIFFQNNVATCVFAFGNIFMGYVRYVQKYVSHVFLCLVHDFLQSLVGGLQFGDFSFDILGLVFFAFLHQTADLPCQLILLLLIGIELLLRFSTDFVVF